MHGMKIILSKNLMKMCGLLSHRLLLRSSTAWVRNHALYCLGKPQPKAKACVYFYKVWSYYLA